jgi:hypothetical protein
MQCPTDPVCESGLRPAFDRARQRSNGFVHIENHVPEPLDLMIKLVDLDFVEVVILKQSPHCIDKALSSPNDIKSAAYDDVEHDYPLASIMKRRP